MARRKKQDAEYGGSDEGGKAKTPPIPDEVIKIIKHFRREELYGQITDVDDVDRVFEFRGVKHYLEHYAIWRDVESGKMIYIEAFIARFGHEKDGRRSWSYGQAIGILKAMLEMAPFEFNTLSIKLLQTQRVISALGKPEEVNAEEAARFAQAFGALTEEESKEYFLLLPHERGEYLRNQPAFSEPLNAVRQAKKKRHKLRTQVETLAKEDKLVDWVMRHLPEDPKERSDRFKQALVEVTDAASDDDVDNAPRWDDYKDGKEETPF